MTCPRWLSNLVAEPRPEPGPVTSSSVSPPPFQWFPHLGVRQNHLEQVHHQRFWFSEYVLVRGLQPQVMETPTQTVSWQRDQAKGRLIQPLSDVWRTQVLSSSSFCPLQHWLHHPVATDGHSSSSRYTEEASRGRNQVLSSQTFFLGKTKLSGAFKRLPLTQWEQWTKCPVWVLFPCWELS